MLRKSTLLPNSDLKSPGVTTPLFVLLIVVFLLLSLRCLYLQYFQSEHYYSLSVNQQAQKPQRGVILDSRGRLLAGSNRVWTIFAEPRVIKDPKAVSTELVSIVDMDGHQIHRLITESKNPGFAKIKIGAEADQCDAAVKIYGIGVQSDWQRHYPAGALAGHVVGFTSTDNRGLAGIELQYNKELCGSAGQNVFLADVRRRPLRLKQQNSVLKDGTGVILTIDSAIQQFTRAELLKQFESYEAESAIAIVAEPKTGAILAMVSLPDFIPGQVQSSDPNNLRNRSVTDQFEPGSIIKPIVAAIAIDSGTVNTDEKIFCENGNYRGRGFGRIHEYRDHGYGNLAIREILIKSSNIGMAKIGQRMGKKKLYRGLSLFGFGKKTGLDLPGEAQGLLRPVGKWTGYSVTRIPYGYEISATALQMVRAYCILANGGRPVRLHLAKATADSDGKVTKLQRPPPAVGFVIKPEVAKWIITNPLVGVINERQNGGTGWRARLKKWQVFGKTGTANTAKLSERGYEENANIASFIAGAPVDDPAVVVLVSVCKPNRKLGKGDSGGAVASPVAAKIIEKTLTYLGVP